MDLRQFRATPEQAEAAAQLLRYQPFVLDDDRHTGVAYTLLYTSDPSTVLDHELFLFDRRKVSPDVWAKAQDANRWLAAMYDGFIDRIVDICPPGGAYLDVGCNTGYFPVKASLSGIRAAGIDKDDYTDAVQLLNEITGASAKFSVGSYDPRSHTIRMKENFGVEKFDVVSASALLCHLPDPLHFLTALARLASNAVLIWNTFLETEELLIHYNPPNKHTDREFPNGFDEGTSISLGLLLLSMSKLGFTHYERLKMAPEGMPESWSRPACLHTFLFWR